MLRSLGLTASTIAICILVVVANLGYTIVGPVLPTIRDYFGSSATEMGLMVSGFGFGRLAMDLPAGLLTDRFSPTRLFIVGILVSGVASALAAFSTGLPQLIVFRVGMGFGAAIMSTVGLVTLVNAARPDERGKVLAFYTSANLLGAALGPAVGGFLASLYGWREIFIFCAVTPLISLPLNLLVTSGVAARKLEPGPLLGKTVPQRDASRRVLPESKGGGSAWAGLITVYFSTFVVFFNQQGMLWTLLPLYAGSVLGMNPVSIGSVLSSRAIFTILITLPAGALADRIGRKALLMPALVMAVAGNLYVLAGESVLIFTTSAFLMSMNALSASMLSTLVADLVRGRSVGKAMGMYRFTGDLGTALGPAAMGLIMDHLGFTSSSLFAAGMVLVVALVCALLLPRKTTVPSSPTNLPQ